MVCTLRSALHRLIWGEVRIPVEMAVVGREFTWNTRRWEITSVSRYGCVAVFRGGVEDAKAAIDAILE